MRIQEPYIDRGVATFARPPGAGPPSQTPPFPAAAISQTHRSTTPQATGIVTDGVILHHGELWWCGGCGGCHSRW